MPGPSSPQDPHAHDIVAAVSGEPIECPQSTGPRTEEGERTSRRDALPYGLTAETRDCLENANEVVRALSVAHPEGQVADHRCHGDRPQLAAFIWAINREVVGSHATANQSTGVMDRSSYEGLNRSTTPPPSHVATG
jgi:hypothetical protein